MRFLALILLLSLTSSFADEIEISINEPPHSYLTRQLNDPFTKLIPRLQSGEVTLDRSSEKAFLRDLLKTLNIPASSQLLVFSTTSLQLSLISPRNPRALYFNDEIFVGYIPGGKIEIISIDPHLGAIFYIFDIPRSPDRPLAFDRSNRCMNCHSGEETGYVPGLAIESVVPGPGGGSLDAFRVLKIGHEIPLEDRFGGWHLTGKHNLTNHLANITGRYVAGSIHKIPNDFGASFSPDKYLVPTSDILPHLIHEHQAGFINRVTKAAYLMRHDPSQIDKLAADLTAYITFANEAPLPAAGIEGDADFVKAFASHPLKELDLKTRLFKLRCSYMIRTPLFQNLPAALKAKIYQGIREARHIPANEKKAISNILAGLES